MNRAWFDHFVLLDPDPDPNAGDPPKKKPDADPPAPKQDDSDPPKQDDDDGSKTVPLSALQAERKRRQEIEARLKAVEDESAERKRKELEEQGKWKELAEQREADAKKARDELEKHRRGNAMENALRLAGVGEDRLSVAKAAFEGEAASVESDKLGDFAKEWIGKHEYLKGGETRSQPAGPGHKAPGEPGDRLSELRTKREKAKEEYQKTKSEAAYGEYLDLNRQVQHLEREQRNKQRKSA